MPSSCVFGKPYIRGLCDPIGRIALYIHFGIRLALTKSISRFSRRDSMLAVLPLVETEPSILNFDWSSSILFISYLASCCAFFNISLLRNLLGALSILALSLACLDGLIGWRENFFFQIKKPGLLK